MLDIVNDTRLLSRFLFPHDMLNNRVGTLSGGERRRLYLLTILMSQPNLLVMDEPTNDLDIVTLNILEEYLKEFSGTLIIISHDRHFLDRLADHLFVFCGDGVVKDFVGSYSEYREFIREYERTQNDASAKTAQPAAQAKTGGRRDGTVPAGKKKLTYAQQRELERLEKEIEEFNAEKASLEAGLSGGNLPFDELQKASTRIGEVMALIDEKEMRWLELSC